jgi:hypothetical protein
MLFRDETMHFCFFSARKLKNTVDERGLAMLEGAH